MNGSVSRSVAAGIAISLGLVVLGGTPCFAQARPGAMARGLSQGSAPKPAEAPPPVLPGTKAPGEVAAPTQPLADLSPTEALFDAVNRGDIATARDAVNRGARADEPNLLGLTALELAVDLGRNNIAFYLLSIRGGDSVSRADADRRDGDRPAATAPRSERRRVASVAARSFGPADEPATATPHYSSGNAGAPIPAAGFVGFGGGR